MHCVIVGNGIAGLTATRYLRKLDDEVEITMIGKETPFPFSRPGLMYINTEKLLPKDLELYERWFYPQNRIQLIHNEVTNINAEVKTIHLENGNSISYDKLLLATGSYPRMFNWKNDHLKGIYNYNDMPDALNMQETVKKAKSAVVVGGGLTGLEVVECLHLQGLKVTYLVREPWYFDRALNQKEAQLIHKRLKELGVDLKLEEEVSEFIGNESVEGVLTSKNNTISCDAVYLTIGVVSNTALAKDIGLECNRGIVVNEFQQSSHPDILAAGDCAEIPDGKGGGKVELLWYTARNQGKIAAHNMLNIKNPYNSGAFYNYARFLDIDYATIGRMAPLADGESEELLLDEKNNISIRIAYNTEQVLGFNMLGLRWKRQVLEDFIHHKKSLAYVKQHLHRAMYNPEFSKNRLKELIHA